MKIFIEVKTPGNGKTYEFQLDNSMTIGQVKEKMIGEITDLENGNITLKPETAILGDLVSGKRLIESDILRDTEIRSGGRLVLL